VRHDQQRRRHRIDGGEIDQEVFGADVATPVVDELAEFALLHERRAVKGPSKRLSGSSGRAHEGGRRPVTAQFVGSLAHSRSRSHSSRPRLFNVRAKSDSPGLAGEDFACRTTSDTAWMNSDSNPSPIPSARWFSVEGCTRPCRISRPSSWDSRRASPNSFRSPASATASCSRTPRLAQPRELPIGVGVIFPRLHRRTARGHGPRTPRVYRKTWIALFRGLGRQLAGVPNAGVSSLWHLNEPDTDPNYRLLFVLAVATVPVGIAGILLEHKLRVLFAKPLAAAIFLTINGVILLVGERLRRNSGRHVQFRKLERLTLTAPSASVARRSSRSSPVSLEAASRWWPV